MSENRRHDIDTVKRIGSAVLDSMLSIAAPIWFIGPNGLNNATCTLITLAHRRVGVTCDHVLKGAGSNQLIVAGQSIRHGQVIASCPSSDLAVLDLEPQAEAIVSNGRRFHEPVRWPPGEVCDNDVIALCGFPGRWREDAHDDSRIAFYAFGHGMTGVDAVSEDHMATQLKLRDCTHILDTGKSEQDLRGMSGGPVLVYRDLHLELVGFIYEDQRQFDIMRIRRASVIDEYGRIRS